MADQVRHRRTQPSSPGTEREPQSEQTHGTPSRAAGVAPPANALWLTTAGQPALPQTFFTIPPHLDHRNPTPLYYLQPSQSPTTSGTAQSYTGSTAPPILLPPGAFRPFFGPPAHLQYPPEHPQLSYHYRSIDHPPPFGPSPAPPAGATVVPSPYQPPHPQHHPHHMPPQNLAPAWSSAYRTSENGQLAPTVAHQVTGTGPSLPPLAYAYSLSSPPPQPAFPLAHIGAQTRSSHLEVARDPRLQNATEAEIRSDIRPHAGTSMEGCNRSAATNSRNVRVAARPSRRQEYSHPVPPPSGVQWPSSANRFHSAETAAFALNMPTPSTPTTSNRRSYERFQENGSGQPSHEYLVEVAAIEERRRRLEAERILHADQVAAAQIAQHMQAHEVRIQQLRQLQQQHQQRRRRIPHRNTPTNEQLQALVATLRANCLLHPHLPTEDNTCGICTKEYAGEKCDASEDRENAILVPCPAKHVFGEWCIMTWIRTCLDQKNVIACPTCRKALIAPREKPARAPTSRQRHRMFAATMRENMRTVAAEQQREPLTRNQGGPGGPYMGEFVVNPSDPTTFPLALPTTPVTLPREHVHAALAGESGEGEPEAGEDEEDDEEDEEGDEDSLDERAYSQNDDTELED
ncbi:uncharacterized protein EI97DRAFT_445456 [Westerdykella ornata]|uniref:Anaphase-promoting complex subunit 11 RING-H2 finger domain-containing protein n=1 Tax=Westerdykella ornata TaxID=318751 RepID=A0A6A6J9G1_WESOR|nr:uncharacterized protein EI97DRAFT_445456 [Westerdykella ornata]KAF2272844.1 hypothetical protein EI97DRAFT_445456 [Westerdykella ornata]